MKIDVVKSGAPRPLANYSEAMVAGPWIFMAGQLASDFKTGVPAEARKLPSFPFYGSDIKLQTRFVLENLKRTFEAAGSALDNVFKARVFLTDLDDFFAFDEVWKEYFKVPPARTTVGTTGLLVKDTLIEIDLIGLVPGRRSRSRSSSRMPRVPSPTTTRVSGSAISYMRPDRSPATTRPAFRATPCAARIFPTTSPTSSCRPDTSWKISRRRSRRPEARSTRSSRLRSSSPTSAISTASTRCGRSISRSRRRARRSVPPASWSRTRWSRST